MKKFEATLGEHTVRVILLESAEWAEKAIARLSHSQAAILGLDLETAAAPRFINYHEFGGLSPHCSRIRLIQIYDSSVNATYMFDMFKLGTKLLPFFQALFQARRFVAHYAVFDLSHLKHNGMPVKTCDCTLILANIVERARTTAEEVKSSLQALVASEFKTHMPKEMQRSDWSRDDLSEDQLNYAALDPYFTSRLADRYLDYVRRFRMQKHYALNRKLQHVVVDMQLRGIKTDRRKHAEMIYKWEQERFNAEKELETLMPGVNLNSSKQLTEWLKSTLSADDLARWPLTDTGKALSTSADTFNSFEHLPVVEPISRYKKVEKMCSTYGRTLYHKQNPATGRLHGNFTIGVTRTGRLSGRNPNLTNQPRKEKNFKQIFIPERGYIFLCADLNQIELRVLAQISRDPIMLKAYENGKDLHSVMAAVISNKKIKEITKEERQLAKALNFGLCFGAGAATLQTYAKVNYDIAMSLDQAQEYVNLFHKLYAGYARWKKEHTKRCEQSLLVKTPLGKIRKLHPKMYYTTSLNTPIQGGAAEIIIQAAVDLHKAFEKLDAHILLLVHDEILVEVVNEPETVAAATAIVVASMTQAAEKIFPGIITRGIVEAYAGLTWQEAKH